jgi:hypothetical protein
MRSASSAFPRKPAASGRANTTRTTPTPAKMTSRHAHRRQKRYAAPPRPYVCSMRERCVLRVGITPPAAMDSVR